jgi:hypothetical protein
VALEAYSNDKHSVFCNKKANDKVRQAALALAGAIRESSSTSEIVVMDNLVWLWALGAGVQPAFRYLFQISQLA